jgi:1-deoxy-D-xylulose-5-phosphate synthase
MSERSGRLIDTLALPKALGTLDAEALRRIAVEVREAIIETVSRNGGHLGSSLGVVELTIALHAELDTPKDAIIWDVGHQSYAHKLLTGRASEFNTIRTYGGLSGFPSRDESVFDAYGTGHASTSVSAAVGMVEARRLGERKTAGGGPDSESGRVGLEGRVVAVIGDGALTGGMAYEALNHAGHLRTPVLVVLNDNNMSIEKNVGAMSSYLSRLRTDPTLSRLRRDVDRWVERLPGVGRSMVSLGQHVKDSIKAAIVPGMLFEELGFTYVGVIDGHDIEAVRDGIRRSLAVEGPVLLHCKTVKGKGYAPAERQPGRYHGTPAFTISTGEPMDPEGPTTFTEAFGEAVVDMARLDERVVGITAAMAAGTGLDLLKKEMPERFFDVGIAEAHAVGFAAGLAAAGKKPIVAVYSTFLQRAYDQVIHDVCLQGLPVVFAVDRAGLVGSDGSTHHGAFDLSFLRVLPGLSIFVPRDEAELQRLVATALQCDGPSVIRYPRSAGTGVPLLKPIEPLTGPWVDVVREGSDVLLLGVGPEVHLAEEAACLLEAQGISATVAAVTRVRPLDVEVLLALVLRHRGVVTIEDNALAGGFGSALLELLSDSDVVRPVKRAGLPDAFVRHGPVDRLRQDVGLTTECVVNAAKVVLSGANSGTG